MKELPKVYPGVIDKNIRNNKELFYSRIGSNRSVDVLREIDNIFLSKDFVYKSDVSIVLREGTIDTVLVGKNQNYLLTMDGKKIKISDIIDIKKRA